MEDMLDLFSDLDAAPSVYKGDKWDLLADVLANDPDLNFKEDPDSLSMAERITLAIDAIKDALLQGYTIALGWSGGKDSTVTLHLFLFALVQLVRAGKGQRISQYSWVGHTDTGIENPEVRYLADRSIVALQRFIEEEGLPLTVAVERPSLASSWPGRILTGRGLPTFVNSSARQCSNELKVGPAKRLTAKMRQRMPKEQRKKICLLLGSRDAESTTRAGNIAKRGGNDIKLTVMPDGSAELYPVKSWNVDQIWETLLACGSGDSPLLTLPSFVPDNKETAELYRAATGECIWGGKDQRKSEACGARFGCAFCTAVGTDDSMEQMLFDTVDGEKVAVERYAYMQGLNRLQRYLIKTQWDWSCRHPVGRTIYADGYIRLQPDVYSPSFLRRLLHVCCSLDYQEEQRAVENRIKLLMGEIEDNEHNRRMCEPQFRVITPSALIHIAFLWSFHHFNPIPFEAIQIYRKVWLHGELDLLEDEPSLPVHPKSTIDREWWVKVPRWGDGSLADGLADPMAVMTYFDGQDDVRAARVVNTWDGRRAVVAFTEDSETRIDQEAAEWVIWEDFPRLWEQVQDGILSNTEAARYFLRLGVISVARGTTGKMHQMMQRGQTLSQLGLAGDKSMLDVLMDPSLEVIPTKVYHRQLSEKISRAQRRSKRLLYLGLVIDMNLQLHTEIGLAIDAQLKTEQRQARLAELTKLANRVESMGMSIISLRAEWLTQPAGETKYGAGLIRQWRRAILEITRGLSRKERAEGKILTKLWLTLDAMDAALCGSTDGRYFSEQVKDAAALAPWPLARSIDVWRKQLSKLEAMPSPGAKPLMLVASNGRRIDGDAQNQLALAM